LGVQLLRPLAELYSLLKLSRDSEMGIEFSLVARVACGKEDLVVGRLDLSVAGEACNVYKIT
jgi:hypothetical protein